MNTIPEAPETIEAQMRWLVEGKRRAVLVPPGTELPELSAGYLNLDVFVTEFGLFFYRPDLCSRTRIVKHIHDNTVGDLLGYGIPRKPENADECIVIRGANGREKQSVVIPPAEGSGTAARIAALDRKSKAAMLAAVPEPSAIYAAASALAGPGDTITREPAAKVIAERCDELSKHELTLHPFRDEDAQALQDLARDHPAARMPNHPTWVIRRHGKTVGAVGINSLPLYHLWMPVEDITSRQSHDVLKHIENTYRLAGHPVVATLIDVDCRSYSLAARHGYMELTDERVFFKQLETRNSKLETCPMG